MKFRHFKTKVPIWSDFHIKNAYVFPYKVFESATKGESTSSAHMNVITHCKRYNEKMWRLVFPGINWRSFDQELKNPKWEIGVAFTVGKGCRAGLGVTSGIEFFVIDEVIYQRVTWADIHIFDQHKGLLATVDRKDEKNHTFFVKPCIKANEKLMHATILNALKGLFEDPEAVC